MDILPRGIVYTTWDLAMEASYTIHENDYWHNKQQYSLIGKYIVANYVLLSITLYFAGIAMNTVDSKQAANTWMGVNTV